MRDIVNATGYSLGTVSQALNHKPGVAPETRAQIIEAAHALGYPTRTRSSHVSPEAIKNVGLLVKQDSDLPYMVNPFYSYVLAGAEQECQQRGIGLMFASVNVDDMNRIIQWPTMLFDERVNGLIVVGTFLEGTIAEIDQQVEAMVLVDAYAPGLMVDSIVTDNFNGALAAVNYLLDCGHTHIGLIGSTPDAYPSIRERRNGYICALKQVNIETTYIEDGPLTRESGYATTLALLTRAPEVTAIFACNDNVALGVMDAAKQLNLNIPNDLSLIGFDNIDLAQEVFPPLTTIHVNKTLLGRLGVRYLCDPLARAERASLTTLVNTELIIRDSVRALE